MNKINPNRAWFIHYASFTKNAYPIQLKEENNAIVFIIYKDEQTKIQIKIPKQITQSILQGTYTVLDQGYTAPITFYVKNHGELLEGSLSGDLARFKFSISTHRT